MSLTFAGLQIGAGYLFLLLSSSKGLYVYAQSAIKIYKKFTVNLL